MQLLIAAVLVAVASASAAPQTSWMKAAVMPMPMPMPLMHGHGHHAVPKEGGAEILEHAFDMAEPGRYLYHFRTNNGIAMMEQSAPDKVQGAYEWTSPEGVNYKVEYVADEMGFHPVAAHLPVAPEVPVAIQRSLQWNAAHPEEDAAPAHIHLAKKIMY